MKLSLTSNPTALVGQRLPQPTVAPSEKSAQRPVDRLMLGQTSQPQGSMVEADLSLRMDGSPFVTGNGTVKVQRTFLERAIRMAFSGTEAISDAQIRFDPASQSYAIAAKVDVKGLKVPVTAKLNPTSDHNHLAIQLKDVTIPTSLGALSLDAINPLIVGHLSKVLAQSGYGTKADAKQGIVEVDPNTLLHRLGALPYYIGIDTQQTRFSANLSAQGDLVVGLQSDRKGPAVSNTDKSDITITADDESVAEGMRQLMGRDYLVKKVTFEDGGAKVDGSAEYKPGSEAITGAKALLAILALAARAPGAAKMDMSPEELRVPLQLAVKTEGSKLTITPSISRAREDLESSLKNAGFHPKIVGDGLQVDLNDLWGKKDARIEAVNMHPGGVDMRMRMDLDSFFGPALKGDPEVRS